MDLYLLQASGQNGNALSTETMVTEPSPISAIKAALMIPATQWAQPLVITTVMAIWICTSPTTGENTLLRNEGDGRFLDVSAESGTDHPGLGASATFFDGDKDGDLDLFICNYVDWSTQREIECRSRTGQLDYCAPIHYAAPSADVLYRNNGDGTFTDMSIPSGIAAKLGNGLGVVARDFNGDGLADIFVANDGNPDRLWINLGELRFEDAAMRLGCDRDFSGTPKAGMGVVAEDLDDDGDIDLLVCNLVGESDSLFLNEVAGSLIQPAGPDLPPPRVDSPDSAWGWLISTTTPFSTSLKPTAEWACAIRIGKTTPMPNRTSSSRAMRPGTSMNLHPEVESAIRWRAPAVLRSSLT